MKILLKLSCFLCVKRTGSEYNFKGTIDRINVFEHFKLIKSNLNLIRTKFLEHSKTMAEIQQIHWLSSLSITKCFIKASLMKIVHEIT